MAESGTTPSNSQSPQMDLGRHFKRKFEDVMQSLDEAVGQPSPHETGQPPAKKVRTGRSLYATLAKYGITKDPKPTKDTTSRFESLSKTAPGLSRILSRTATRTRKMLPFRQPKSQPEEILPTSSNSEYRPSSTASFLHRLATYKLTTYANKPPAIDAVAAAKCGWVNDGKDRLVCGICDISWVVVGKEGMSRDAANALVGKQRVQLVDMHKSGCPWKTNQCDSSIYRVPLQTPTVMVRGIKYRAEKLETALQDVQIKHPLTSTQVQSLVSIIHSVKSPEFAFSFEPPLSPPQLPPIAHENSPPIEPSETAILVSLFGWSLPPPAPPSERKGLPSLSRASSIAPSAPGTPMRPRTPSGPFSPSSSSPTRPPLLIRAETLPTSIESAERPKSESTFLHCSLCQRRIGLWAFMPGAGQTPLGKSHPTRQFDILKEHRSYCPYAVRSTVLPTPPVPQHSHSHSQSTSSLFASASNPSVAHFHGEPGAIEGWRAVLTVVSRYGAAKRQRIGLPSISSDGQLSNVFGESPGDDPMEQDEVGAMVAEVKSHGGRDLLRYVKGLLG